MSWLTQILGGDATPGRPAFDAVLAPAERLAVIGDVHGCDRLLLSLLNRLGALDLPPDRLVFTGDLIDRGENSATVLSVVYGLHRRLGEGLVALRGNHEQMMLDFLDSPVDMAARWLRYGGLQTLASFGVSGATETMDKARAVLVRDKLAETLGPTLIDWLWDRPTLYSTGNVHVVHAGADPALPIDRQSAHTLVWGHPDFLRRERRDGQWIIHGHTVVDTVEARGGRIGVDTGAYATGRLSAAVIEPGAFRAISVPD